MRLAVPRPQISDIAWPERMQDLCPEVLGHFSRFSYFPDLSPEMPIATTTFAAHSVCSMAVATRIATAVGAALYLHAGSHLGAILHGGPMP